MLKRIINIFILTIATLVLMAVSNTYAQTVPIPNPAWPTDTVFRTTVHLVTVQGDPNYTEASTFTWHVYGGRLFFDQSLTSMAGDGTTATVTGDASNNTQLWVVWDAFQQASYNGYVYVTELSSNGCELNDSVPEKYRGMNVTVIAPADVRFLAQVTNTCSYNDEVIVDIAIKGIPPFNLKYSINGVLVNWDITDADMFDSDMDGVRDNASIVINDFTGTPDFKQYNLVLLESSSGGVPGKILPNYPSHTVNVYVQPPAPLIDQSLTEVTVGKTHQFALSTEGVNVDNYFWELYTPDGLLSMENETRTTPYLPITFGYPLGEYKLVAFYLDKNGCMSFADTLNITVYGEPTIAFADTSGNASGCSALNFEINDAFEFVVEYSGATSYNFRYAVYDYENKIVDGYPKSFDFETRKTLTLSIPNTFINYELPEIDRQWRVVILDGTNEERIEINVLDGKGERTITVHPKPIITEDIDFAN